MGSIPIMRIMTIERKLIIIRIILAIFLIAIVAELCYVSNWNESIILQNQNEACKICAQKYNMACIEPIYENWYTRINNFHLTQYDCENDIYIYYYCTTCHSESSSALATYHHD